MSTARDLPRHGTAVIPDAHDVELAARSRTVLETLAQSGTDLTVTIAGDERQIHMPASAVRLLSAAMSEMASGHAISLLPLDADLTTQQAADLLNVSRPYLVGLLDRGDMRIAE